VEYWNDGSESRNNYAFGHEYSKGSFQVSAALGIIKMKKGKELKKRIKPLTESVQELRLPYIPCRMFNNETFGGFVAENYRALTMLSPWLFLCLLDKVLSPPIFVLPPHEKPRDNWTMKENAAWLKVRGIKVAQKSSAAERTSQVDGYFNQPNGPP
jgi:hypothetical protein